MTEVSLPLSAASLRLAGHVGQTALDRIAGDGVAALAELDQHIAAVRAEVRACQRGGAAGALGAPASVHTACPDVPFVNSALRTEAVLPIQLLLHYACGFVEAAVRSDWWPGESADSRDWPSMRLAAICQLIIQAEVAAELHPDLRTIA